MATVQISKIIHRTGANVDLPQLDVGEIGFATDEQRVYIGNDPTIVPPAPGGTTQTEILTSASSLDFSRINGASNATMDLSSPQNGQLLGINVAANTATIVNVGGNAGGTVTLGNISNVKISGGVNGFVLSTDGTGNLTWTTNGALRSTIQSIANVSNLAVFTTQSNHFFNTGSVASIADTLPSAVQSLLQTSGISGTNRFFVNRRTSNTFSLHTAANAIAGNVNFDPLFTGYTANSGTIVGQITPSGNATPGGSNTQLQFNDAGGVFGGSAALTFNKTTNALAHTGAFSGNTATFTGNITALNANLGNVVTANFFTGTIRTNAQPNITSVGTLANLYANVSANVTGNTLFFDTVTKEVTYGSVITTAPVANNSAGTAGQIAVDDDYIYVCVAANTWVRSVRDAW
jgi:hypothetical protein